MARIICKICGWNVTDQQTGILIGRTAHLKNAHAIAPYDGVVKDYFLHPWELKEQTFNNIPQHPLGTKGGAKNE